MYPVGTHKGVAGARYHNGVGRKMVELVVVDDRFAGIFRDYPHRRSAADVIAANHRTSTDQVDRDFGCIGKLVALDQYRNVARYHAAAIPVEVVLTNTDGTTVRVQFAADRPQTRVLVLKEGVADYHRVATRGGEAHPDPVVREPIVLEENVAGVFPNINAHVPAFNPPHLQMQTPPAHQPPAR